MNEAAESNSTPLSDNWTLYNSSPGSGEQEWEGLALARNNITYVGFYLHQPSTAAIFIVSYLLIFLVCMVGNGVVCFIVLRSKNMRTVTNLFILNLAVSDLLVGIFCMPTTLLDNIITGESLLFPLPLLDTRQHSSSTTDSAASIVIVLIQSCGLGRRRGVYVSSIFHFSNTSLFGPRCQTETCHLLRDKEQEIDFSTAMCECVCVSVNVCVCVAGWWGWGAFLRSLQSKDCR